MVTAKHLVFLDINASRVCIFNVWKLIVHSLKCMEES